MGRLFALLLVFLPLWVATMAAARGDVFLHEGAEQSSKLEVVPERWLANAVIRHIDDNDKRILNTCLAERHYAPGDYRKLLRAVRLSTQSTTELWFVRPATDNDYCGGALYGAHLFRYFVIARSGGKYRTVFSNGGDSFEVLRTMHHDFPDLRTIGCAGGGCDVTHQHFDGRRYRRVACGRIAMNGTEKRIKCW